MRVLRQPRANHPPIRGPTWDLLWGEIFQSGPAWLRLDNFKLYLLEMPFNQNLKMVLDTGKIKGSSVVAFSLPGEIFQSGRAWLNSCLLLKSSPGVHFEFWSLATFFLCDQNMLIFCHCCDGLQTSFRLQGSVANPHFSRCQRNFFPKVLIQWNMLSFHFLGSFCQATTIFYPWQGAIDQLLTLARSGILEC